MVLLNLIRAAVVMLGMLGLTYLLELTQLTGGYKIAMMFFGLAFLFLISDLTDDIVIGWFNRGD